MTEQQIFQAACEAAIEAFKNNVPDPMFVRYGNQVDRIDEGMCGFAHVKITPARGKFVTYLKKNGVGRKSYVGGYDVNMGSDIAQEVGFSQSYSRKYAAAKAFAEVLNANGITAYADARYD